MNDGECVHERELRADPKRSWDIDFCTWAHFCVSHYRENDPFKLFSKQDHTCVAPCLLLALHSSKNPSPPTISIL